MSNKEETHTERWLRLKREMGVELTDSTLRDRIAACQAEANAKRRAEATELERRHREHPEEYEIAEGLRCSGCGQTFNEYRSVAHKGYGEPGWCGDCYGGGCRSVEPLDVRIAAVQPKPSPEPAGAWMTPTWDGEF